ncbi:hypothetical protein [Staphylococcus simiae]|uniref:Uncharacterized protein n=1 Tax=Staphylococcus simiae CCM 7213 = CCUG 51256 TaxID=911238 RepID=G5JK67_9STAP|nr:hypothetical protein [Staphylococcus simiae]EHJ07397.1 hypothetical protein SS7213T_09394 [Staphylococcus simiae CCM 7213 = CCUG 51256]PNZ09477.1 hypothetical protein CD113_12195 [Staphylococcus simiae]SNV54552.1 Uncharacterised protein [Staphylococcus simiae]
MVKENWQMIKAFLNTQHDEDIFKGFIAHYYDINDTYKLNQLYLMYMDDDNILSMINEDIIDMIEGNEK